MGQAPAVEGPDGSQGPHVFVSDLHVLDLDDDDRHHLERVLRLRAGDALTASDGAGRWRPCRFGSPLEAVGEIRNVHRPAPAVTVGFALVKGGRPELIVQKLTELGVDAVRPFTAERSVVRWDAAKVAANHRRLTRVAREACAQSRRCYVPEVAPAVPFAEVAGLPGAVRADRGGPPAPADLATVLVGPEGGWSDAERRSVPATVGLGPHVLRAETAAIAAGVVLAGVRFGAVAGRPAPPDHAER